MWLPDGLRFLVVRFAYGDDHAKDAGIYAGSIGSKDLTLVAPGRIAEVALSNDETAREAISPHSHLTAAH